MPTHTRVCRFATTLAAAALSTSALGEMTFISSERRVSSVSVYDQGSPEEQHFENTDFDRWFSTCATAASHAGQSSEFSEGRVHYQAWVNGWTLPGVSGTGTSTMSVEFAIDTPMRWDLLYWTYPFPPSEILPHRLFRVGSDLNEFASVPWEDGILQPVFASGYLDAGIYRLEYNTTSTDALVHEEMTFTMTVPAPGAASLLLAATFAFRRRSRR